MNTKQISLKQIIPDPDQPRKIFKSSDMEELKNSIKEQGVLTPLIIESNYKDDKYLLLDGERRYRCVEMLNIEKVPVQIMEGPLTYEERTTIRFHVQEQHSSWTEIDKARAIYKYRKATKKTIAEIAEKLNLHVPKVHAYLSITEFTKAGQKLIIEKNIPFTYLIFLIRIVKNYLVFTEFKQEEIEEKLIEKISSSMINTVSDISVLSNIISANGQEQLKIDFLEKTEYTLSKLVEDSGEEDKKILNRFYKISIEINDTLTDLITNELELSEEHKEKLYAIQKKIEKII